MCWCVLSECPSLGAVSSLGNVSCGRWSLVFLWFLLCKPQMLSFMDRTRDGSWPQNIVSCQYILTVGSIEEEAVGSSRELVSQSKTNSFQDLVHKTVAVSKRRWETSLFWVLDEQMHLLYQIWINTVFLGNTHLI